jgi:hypothetical protein
MSGGLAVVGITAIVGGLTRLQSAHEKAQHEANRAMGFVQATPNASI